ncbi:MAG: hypothetical protein M3R36_09735 [Bacteroidota bacterium]|nr:hypothetical protein [Bacteroidota bacterium]
MAQSKSRLYISFVIIFIIFQITGSLVDKLPYILTALISFTVVFSTVLIFDKWHFQNTLAQVVQNLGFHKTKFEKYFPEF